MNKNNSNEPLSLPILYAKFYGQEPLKADDFKELDPSRDSIPLVAFSIFWCLFIIQTIIFVVIAYGLTNGLFDELCYRKRCKIPFYSSLYQEPEQEYEKDEDDYATTMGGDKD